MSEQEPLAHIYAQEFWHCDSYIIANKEGLSRIREALNEAIASESGESSIELMCNDGEGYTLKVVRREGEEVWNKLALPYTDADVKDEDLKIGVEDSLLMEHLEDKARWGKDGR